MPKVLILLLLCISANALAQQWAVRDWLIQKQWEKVDEARAEEREFKKLERMINRCQADGLISYAMDKEKVKVNAQIDHQFCGASEGEYTVVVNARDAEGNLESKDHKEKWSRNNESTVFNTHFYKLKGDETLISVQVVANEADFCICIY